MIYSIALYLYALAVVLVSPFRKKAWLMVKGQWNTFRILRKNIRREEMYVWFHAASLGEFEQGRPLMERLRREHPEYKILLTFFSPSGYEVRKDYEGRTWCAISRSTRRAMCAAFCGWLVRAWRSSSNMSFGTITCMLAAVVRFRCTA